MIGTGFPRRARIVVAIIVAAVAAAAAGSLLFAGSCSRCGAVKQEAAVRYTCPMHPSYISDRPGQCPICGMDLVPLKEESKPEAAAPEAAAGRTAVAIDAGRQQRIGVTTAQVTKGPAVATIRAVGRVAFDPDLAVAQREYIEARRMGDRRLAEAAKQRLRLMGMGEEEIGGLARWGGADKSLVLPEDGAWVYATIYEREFPHVHEGQGAAIELPDGTKIGPGTVRAIDPVLDPMTRSARARIEAGNAQRKLKPNMFVTALLREDLGEKLLVPKSAVIDSGERKLVFLVHQGEHFTPREVVLGPELADAFVVESGLEPGDVVATGALFLIDSESQLKAAAGAMGGHQHD